MVTLNKSYQEIINDFQTATSEHLGIASFETGTIDFLDASAVNKQYPMMFLRPVTGIGYSDRTRTLSFELFSLDLPTLANQSPVTLLSNTEQYLYDILAWFNVGTQQQTYEVTMTSLSPVNEAFQDRVFGWVATIDVIVPYSLDYCNYPSL